ncbi:hypothetical protein [Nostoc sp.]
MMGVKFVLLMGRFYEGLWIINPCIVRIILKLSELYLQRSPIGEKQG